MIRKNNISDGKFIIVAILSVLCLFTLTVNFADAKNMPSDQQIKNVNSNVNEAQKTLNSIDKYQEKYFEIVKRNNVLLSFETNSELKKDRKELKKLFKEVQKQVTNKDYLKEYKAIQKRYAKFNGETTVDINEFAQNYNKEVDTLLNKVYKDVKLKIPAADFKQLVLSERKWLQEVQNYKKVFDSKEFGTIGTSTYYDYETNMKEFRTLLLLLYL